MMIFQQKNNDMIRLEMEQLQARIVAVETAQTILQCQGYNRTADIEKYLVRANREINLMKKAIEWNDRGS